MPRLTGAYLFSFAAQAVAFALYALVLRPDPLLLAQRLDRESAASAPVAPQPDRPALARFAMLAVAASHVTMASVMAMTPVHLSHIVAPDAVTLAVGVTIALHVFGMYGLSPVFGVLADRWGRIPVILLGQALLAASLVTAAVFADAQIGVLVALVLLGLGWSAATVAGSALLTEATPLALRPRRQGRSDTLMTACAAVGSVLAGIILGCRAMRVWRCGPWCPSPPCAGPRSSPGASPLLPLSRSDRQGPARSRGGPYRLPERERRRQASATTALTRKSGSQIA